MNTNIYSKKYPEPVKEELDNWVEVFTHSDYLKKYDFEDVFVYKAIEDVLGYVLENLYSKTGRANLLCINEFEDYLYLIVRECELLKIKASLTNNLNNYLENYLSNENTEI